MSELIINSNFKLNGLSYDKEGLILYSKELINSNIYFSKSLGQFIIELFNKNDYIIVKTSGSTGEPKSIRLRKSTLQDSARKTQKFFDLKPNNTAICFLPLDFIAGKMMLVRSLMFGLQLFLYEPTSKPKELKRKYDFAAMTPMQASNCIDNLFQIEKLLIGGGAISKLLNDKILRVKSKYYESYGMTETASHIAIKTICENSDFMTNYFNTLEGVSINTTEDKSLIIIAPYISKKKIVTNDIVELISKNSFRLLGRSDNIINSGGLKLNPESIENKLSENIPYRFFISSIKDDKLGNKLILLIESKEYQIQQKVFHKLNKYEIPKKIIFLDYFVETHNNKIDRINTLLKIKL